MAKERVLIVGGGFGGVKAALELVENQNFQVTLLSKRDNLRYYPTLYRTATGGKRANSSIPLKDLFYGKPIDVAPGEAVTLDRHAKTVTTKGGVVYPFDTLILALGSVTNYFGIKGLEEYTYGIKSNEQAMKLKAHLHKQMIDERRPDLNYVIVGGGPTGIELAGALPDYLKHLIKQHGLKRRRLHIDIVEAAPRLLPTMPHQVSFAVKRRLKHLKIKLFLNQRVEGASADSLTVNGKPIQSHTVVWTAGATNNKFFNENNFALMQRGKVATDIYLQAENSIFVIGDNANTPYSGMAQTALFDAIFVANNLIRRTRGKSFKSYNPKRPMTVIPCGPHWAAFNFGKLSFSGRRGWLLREIADIVGFHDYKPWPKAVKQWLTGFDAEENCPVCVTNSLTK